MPRVKSTDTARDHVHGSEQQIRPRGWLHFLQTLALEVRSLIRSLAACTYTYLHPSSGRHLSLETRSESSGAEHLPNLVF
jgi:hypothetical protein